MKSGTMCLYKEEIKRDGLTEKQIAFADEVFAMAEEIYCEGGDTIVECFTPREICIQFKTVVDAKEYCGLKKEQADEVRSTVW